MKKETAEEISMKYPTAEDVEAADRTQAIILPGPGPTYKGDHNESEDHK